jgi:hypothetical protein
VEHPGKSALFVLQDRGAVAREEAVDEDRIQPGPAGKSARRAPESLAIAALRERQAHRGAAAAASRAEPARYFVRGQRVPGAAWVAQMVAQTVAQMQPGMKVQRWPVTVSQMASAWAGRAAPQELIVLPAGRRRAGEWVGQPAAAEAHGSGLPRAALRIGPELPLSRTRLKVPRSTERRHRSRHSVCRLRALRPASPLLPSRSRDPARNRPTDFFPRLSSAGPTRRSRSAS